MHPRFAVVLVTSKLSLASRQLQTQHDLFSIASRFQNACVECCALGGTEAITHQPYIN